MAIPRISSLMRSGAGVASSAGFSQHAIGIGMMAGVTAMTNQNGNLGSALAEGAFWYAAESVVPGAFWLTTFGSIAGTAAETYMDYERYGNSKRQKYYRGNFGGEYQDTQQAYTMRQRGVQAIQNSQLNARSVLGSEARTFHRSF